jgi:hypothetical protein
MELFDDRRSKFRPVEVRHGYTLILMHAGCIGKKPRTADVVNDLVRGHQLRREASRIVKGSVVLEATRDESTSPLSLDDELFASARRLLSEENAAAKAEGYVVPAAPAEDELFSAASSLPPPPALPLIHLAEGLDTVRSREAVAVDDGDNGAA